MESFYDLGGKWRAKAAVVLPDQGAQTLEKQGR